MKIFFAALFSLAFVAVPVLVGAQDVEGAKNAGLFTGVSVECWKNGTCTLCDGLVVFITVANTILRLLAIIGVLFFVYGAGYMIMSQGNEEMVSKGKGAMKATIIGAIIVLTAWQLMAFVVYILIGRNEGLLEKTKDIPGKNHITAWYDVANWCKQPEVRR